MNRYQKKVDMYTRNHMKFNSRYKRWKLRDELEYQAWLNGCNTPIYRKIRKCVRTEIKNERAQVQPYGDRY